METLNTMESLIGRTIEFESIPAPFYNEVTEEKEFFTEIEKLSGVIFEEYQDGIVGVKTESGDKYTTGDFKIIK